jgi:hypothetical protein
MLNITQAQPQFWTGTSTVGTTAAVVGDYTPLAFGVVLRADGGNSGVVIIGTTAGNAASGFVLSAGQMSPFIAIDNLNKVFVVGTAAGQKLSWIAS